MKWDEFKAMAREDVEDGMRRDGWEQLTASGWWYPPQCSASWPYDEASVMWFRDTQRIDSRREVAT